MILKHGLDNNDRTHSTTNNNINNNSFSSINNNLNNQRRFNAAFKQQQQTTRHHNMKAIQVKFLPATNFQGARMKAWIKTESVTVPFQYELSCDSLRVELTAQELINKLKWNVKISGIGCLPNGNYVATLK